jgi:hypothetical protein
MSFIVNSYSFYDNFSKLPVVNIINSVCKLQFMYFNKLLLLLLLQWTHPDRDLSVIPEYVIPFAYVFMTINIFPLPLWLRANKIFWKFKVIRTFNNILSNKASGPKNRKIWVGNFYSILCLNHFQEHK